MTQHTVGPRLIVIASLYMVVALVIGMAMGIAGDHRLTSVHTHLGLLGWASMALTGLVYVVVPRCGTSPLARLHFWLHNAGLPLMAISLAARDVWGDARAEPILGIGSILVLLGLLAFAVNVTRNGRQIDQASEARSYSAR